MNTFCFTFGDYTVSVETTDDVEWKRIMELMYDAMSAQGWSVSATKSVEEQVK